MTKLIIDRSKWRTGGSGQNVGLDLNNMFGDTQLLNEKGFMCCLGFYCLQISELSPNEIREIALPSGLDRLHMVEELVNNHDGESEFAERAVFINDSSDPNDLKESQLKQLFETREIELEFINDYPEIPSK